MAAVVEVMEFICHRLPRHHHTTDDTHNNLVSSLESLNIFITILNNVSVRYAILELSHLHLKQQLYFGYADDSDNVYTFIVTQFHRELQSSS